MSGSLHEIGISGEQISSQEKEVLEYIRELSAHAEQKEVVPRVIAGRGLRTRQVWKIVRKLESKRLVEREKTQTNEDAFKLTYYGKLVCQNYINSTANT